MTIMPGNTSPQYSLASMTKPLPTYLFLEKCAAHHINLFQIKCQNHRDCFQSHLFKTCTHSDMGQNFENFWKVKILVILILILILKTTVSKYWFWYWYWNLHFQNIDFDIDIELFGNFDIDIGIDIEKKGELLKILVVRKTQAPLWPWDFG